jgi:hypothetical protein
MGSVNMDELELKTIISTEIDNSIGYLETETVEDRATSMDFYLRKPYGNEVEGKSSIVTGEVAEAVDGALPQLIRVFTSSEDAVRFEATKDGGDEFADQASDVANWVFYKQNDGFLIMHNWFKDALMQKVGVVKAYWSDEKDITKETYEGLTDDELTMLMMNDEFEILEQETLTDMREGMPMVTTHNVKIKRTKDKSKIVVENVPPEEFLIDKRARSIQDAQFVAHRKRIARGELIAMGYDKDVVMNIPVGDRLTYSPEILARYSNGEIPQDIVDVDDAMQEVEIFECYVKVDMNKSGLLELRRVMYANNTILDDEDCDYVPFHSVCPFPIPHKFFGQSLSDRTMDLQLIKSTIMRQMLDNLYLTNNYRVGAVEGQVNLDDLLTSTAGGVVRIKNPGAIVPMTVQSTASQSFPMMEYLDGVQAKRTGVSDMQQGLDPNVLQNVSATAVAAMTQQSTGKLELIARIFAETGVKSLFKGILHLMCKYQNSVQTARIHNSYVQFDPREWDTEYNVTINVGLGNGNRQEQIAMLQMILAKQEQIIQQYGPTNPLVSVTQYRKTLGRMIEMAGFKDTTSFLNEVTPEVEAGIQQQAAQAAQGQSDPTAIFAEVEKMKAQLQAQTAQAKMQAEQAKQQAQIQLASEKLQSDREQAMADIAMKQAELSMYEEKAALEIEMQRVKLVQDEAMADRKQSLEERKQVVAELELVSQSLNDITDVEIAKAELSNLLAQLRG